jgi:serine/threonine protein kinase
LHWFLRRFCLYPSWSLVSLNDCGNDVRNLLLVNSNADHLDVGDFGLSKLLKVKQAHDLYKMTSETGSCEWFVLLCLLECFCSYTHCCVTFGETDRYMAPEVFKHRKVSQTFYCRPHFCNKKLKIPLVNYKLLPFKTSLLSCFSCFRRLCYFYKKKPQYIYIKQTFMKLYCTHLLTLTQITHNL